MPSRKLARRHQRLTGQLEPKTKKAGGRPRWLEKQIKAREKKAKEEYEGAMQWVKYYDDRGMDRSCRTDPLLTFRALGPPPEDQSKSLPPIEDSDGELRTMSDLDVAASSDEDVDASCDESGIDLDDDVNDGILGDDLDEDNPEGSGEDESGGEDEDTPLSKLAQSAKRHRCTVRSPSGVPCLESLCQAADEIPPSARRQSERRARRKAAMDTLARKRARAI